MMNSFFSGLLSRSGERCELSWIVGQMRQIEMIRSPLSLIVASS